MAEAGEQRLQLGVIGDPIAHSLSPVLHSFLIAKLGLSYEYRAYRVASSELQAFLQQARASDFAGLNVTIPHKERVLAYLDGLSADARQLGAVNTIVRQGGQLIGYNTDGLGFRRALEAKVVKLAGRSAIVLGAGGAARAVVYALIGGGIGRLTLANRTLNRAEELAWQLSANTGFQAIYTCALADMARLNRAIAEAELLVNATSVGLAPAVDRSPLSDAAPLHPGLVVYDLVYRPPRTRLLRQAQAAGARPLSGLEMLIYQGIESLCLWTGRPRGEFYIWAEELQKYLLSYAGKPGRE
ncbi:MAG TPA: shikimate dehydrogenase [Candidatus Fraserbacteria bacterium]|nr:shikimate dehydrogenase [Candidatus Fraserbacteria bacterium]